MVCFASTPTVIDTIALSRSSARTLRREGPGLPAGQEGVLRLDARPEASFEVRVENLQRSVEQRSGSDPRRVVRLILTLLENDPRLVRPGMRAHGTIRLQRRDGVLTVPIDAVREAEDGRTIVLGKTLFGSQMRPVELGEKRGGWVEVIAGLVEGDRVRVDA